MKVQNHYQILGVTPFASEDEVKRAYLKLLKEYHPDKKHGHNTFAHKRFQAVMSAYETLKVPEKRNAYDEFLKIQISNEKTASRVNKRNIRLANNDNQDVIFEETSLVSWFLKPFKKNKTTGA